MEEKYKVKNDPNVIEILYDANLKKNPPISSTDFEIKNIRLVLKDSRVIPSNGPASGDSIAFNLDGNLKFVKVSFWDLMRKSKLYKSFNLNF